MAAFSFNFFKASVPRVADHLLTGGHSAEAVDCRFDSGELDCWNEPLAVATVPAGTLRVHRLGCCWLPYASCVDVAEGPVLCNTYYLTGRVAYPETVEVLGCVPTYSRLGVPCAETAPSAVAGNVGDKDLVSGAFSYQYVNARGAVGQSSPISDTVLYNEPGPVVISGWPAPDPSWEVTHVRLAVQVTGHDTGRDSSNQLDTTAMVIADVPIGAASYTFNQYFEELDNAVEENFTRPPPAELRGICRIESMNCLAGFVGKRVYFSENNKPDSWPHFIDTEQEIKSMVESNGVLYLGTYGRPAIISGAADCASAGCRSLLTHPTPYPMVGRNIIALPNGAGYAAKDGFVVLSGNHAPTLLTWPMYAPKDWHQMPPDTVTAAHHQGSLFLFGQGKSALIKLASEGKAGWDADSHTWLSDRVTWATTASDDGELYLLKGDRILRWNASTIRRPHKWVSAEIVSGTTRNFRAAYLYSELGIDRYSLRVDDRVVEDRDVNGTREFVLPGWSSGTRWQLTLTGTARVKLASLATSFKELTA